MAFESIMQFLITFQFGMSYKEKKVYVMESALAAPDYAGLALKSIDKVSFKGTRRCGRYAGLLLAPAEGFGRGKAEAKKETFLYYFGPNFVNIWWSVVTSVTFSSNLSNF